MVSDLQSIVKNNNIDNRAKCTGYNIVLVIVVLTVVNLTFVLLSGICANVLDITTNIYI